MRYRALLVTVGAAMLLPGGCGGDGNRADRVTTVARPGVVPDVTGMALDEAKELLRNRGLSYDVIDEGTGDVVVDSAWMVCDQWPYPAERADAATVELRVEHFCDDEEDWDDDDD